MEDQIGALGLVLNALELFTTRYMDAAVNQLRADGFDIRDTDQTLRTDCAKDRNGVPAIRMPDAAAHHGCGGQPRHLAEAVVAVLRRDALTGPSARPGTSRLSRRRSALVTFRLAH
ncbi:hypothetical protein ABZX95_51130 [Streptomyces sp. NPDC004232]|uniref:hypothetical protein n=1 Tax=Streptomyces sp. NPDC004232 TaxID=3154454 RepID=UPI001D7628BD|nr:Tn3 family transposase [Streptomyces sp. tea 10]